MTQTSQKPRSSAVASASKLTGATILAQLVAVGSAPVITHLYKPEAFGTAAVFASVLAFWQIFGGLRYEMAIPLPKEARDGHGLLALSLCSNTVFAVLGGALLLVFSLGVLEDSRLEKLVPVLWMLPVGGFAQGIALSLESYLTRVGLFGPEAAVKVISVVGMVAAMLLMGISGLADERGLIYAQVIGSGIAAAASGFAIARSGTFSLTLVPSWRTWWALAKEYRKFPLIVTGSSIISQISVQMPVWFLTLFFDARVVGFFALGTRLLERPAALVGQAVAKVFYQRSAEAHHEGRLAGIAAAASEALAKTGLPAFLFLMVMAPQVFSLVFGQEWREAGVFVQILALWRFFVFLDAPLLSLFNVLGRQGAGFLFHSAGIVLRFIALFAGCSLGEPRVALGLYALAGGLLLPLMLLWLLRRAGVAWQQIRKVGRQLAILTGCLLALLYLTATGLKAFPAVSIGTGLLLIAGYYVLFFTRDPLFKPHAARLLRRFLPARTAHAKS